jgi:hypothetical protein
MTRRTNQYGRSRSFAAATELDPVQLLIDGELDTDDLTDEEIEEIIAEVPEEDLATMEENNPDLFDGEEDDEEDELEELTDEDIAEMSDEELIEAIESGEIEVIEEDEDEEDYEDYEDEDEDEDDRSFGMHEEDYDDEDYEEEGYDDDEEEEEFFDGRSFASADEAYHAGIEAGRANAREEAEEVYVTNREAEIRAFALGEQIEEAHDFIDDLVESGQIEPRHRDLAAALMIGAASITGETRSFAAADMGDFGTESLFDIAAEFLRSLPRNTSFDGMSEPGEEDIRSFSADDFDAMNYNPHINREITRAVKGIQNAKAREGQDVSFNQAFEALKRASLKR